MHSLCRTNTYPRNLLTTTKLLHARRKYESAKPKPKFLTPKADHSDVNPVFLYFSESLHRLMDKKEYFMIWKHWERFKRIHKGNVVIWGQMLEVCRATGEVEKGIQLFNEMQQFGIAYNEHCARTILIILLDQEHYDHATFLIHKFLASDDKTILSPYFWNVVLKFYGRTDRLKDLKLTTEHFIELVKCIQKYQRPKELPKLMRQYRTKMAGTKELKRRLFDLVEQSLILDSDFEIQTWQCIMKECGFDYPFPSHNDASKNAFSRNFE